MESSSTVLSFVLQFAPLFLAIAAVGQSQGTRGKFTNWARNHGKRGVEFAKGDARDPHSLQSRTKRNFDTAVTSQRMKNIAAGRDKNANGWQRFKGRVAMKTPGLGPADVKQSRQMAEATKLRQELTDSGDDALIFAGAGYERGGKYYNSKGKEISKDLYSDGKKFFGSTHDQVAAGLQYQLGKAITDEQRHQVRTAFAENAAAGGWTDEQANSVWAAVTYPHKSTHPNEWYSKPDISRTDTRRDASGKKTEQGSGAYTGIEFKDVRGNENSYEEMIDDIHKSRLSFEAGKVRDADWRAMADYQERIAPLIMNGKSTQQQRNNYAKTMEIMDQATREPGYMQRTEGDDGQIQVQATGGSAATAGVLQAAYRNREKAGIKMKNKVDTTTGREMHGTRVLYTGGEDTRPSRLVGPRGEAIDRTGEPVGPIRELGDAVVTGEGPGTDTKQSWSPK